MVRTEMRPQEAEGVPALSASQYASHVFDCDGVLLDTARLKTAAFADVAGPFGPDAVEAMAAIHRSAGSAGRRARVERFYREVVGREPTSRETDAFCQDVWHRLANGYQFAPTITGVEAYLRCLDAPAIVVSGIEQRELDHILYARDLTRHFSAVYGGDKHKLLPRLVAEGVIRLPAVYYGDTRDDWQAATAAGLDFVFVFGASEWKGWEHELPPSVPAIVNFRWEVVA